MDIKSLVNDLGLFKHPEGGYFKEVFRSEDKLIPLAERYQGKQRHAGTSIYYLLEGHDFSAWHRVLSDETWHFYHGCPLNIYILTQTGALETITLGDFSGIPLFQHTVKSNQWFAAQPVAKTSYSLVGCSVYPGFDFNDFELGSREALLAQHPDKKEIIERFCITNQCLEMNLTQPSL